ncbi:MAG: Uma2 family endonuclease [Xanthobacteraceae bacterium]
MAGAPQRKPPRLSVELFRGFVDGRPDEEHWELIDGVAIMMAPPTVAHQCIASNLQRVLYAALERHAPTLSVFQRTGVNLAPAVEYYDPEPDVVVIDSEVAELPGERYANRFYLVAEIVSSSDRVDVAKKRAVYMLHESCRCILTVQQDRCEVRVDLRAENGWTEQVLTKPDDLLELPDFGLRCRIADLYRGTAIQPSKSQR